VYFLGKIELPGVETIVTNLYDQIPLEQAFGRIEPWFIEKKSEIIHNMIKIVAPIRLYLVGNLEYIPNIHSILLIENETDNSNGLSAFQDDKPFALVENEPVDQTLKNNLERRLGCKWNFTRTMPIRLDDRAQFKYFSRSLQSTHKDFKERKRIVDIEFLKQMMDLNLQSTEFSSQVC
jgi:hypothetical protein